MVVILFGLADYASYCQAQERVDTLYRQPKKWAHMAIITPRAWQNSPQIARYMTMSNVFGS